MDQELLVNEEIDAGGKFLDRFAGKFPVRAAFWVRAPGDGQPYLYVASDEIDDATLGEACGEVIRLAGELGNPNFDPFRAKLIGVDDPQARAAMEIYRRFPARIATRYRNKNFGGFRVDDVYVYPPPLAAPVE